MLNGRFVTASLVIVAGVLLMCAGLPAQVILSTVRGTIVDPTGAVIVNAQITLVHQETSATRTTATNENGDFEISGLQLGTYRLTITNPGFKTFVADKIILQSSEIRRVNATLEVGAVGSEVTVTVGAALITTDTTKVEGAVMLNKYPDSPWININSSFLPQAMLTTTPQVQQTGAPWSLQWSGQSSTQVQQGQDGHTNDSVSNQLNNIFDAQEVVVVTGNPTADIARVGYFNQITKSGTNEFHGQFLYMHVNPALATRPFFAATKIRSMQHTTSNGVSGPIIKNKTFFYASFHFAEIPSSQYFLKSVPTTLMRGGDFSQLLALAKPVTIKDPTTGSPFPGNVIPASRLNPLALKVNEKYLPAPNLGGPGSLANNFGFTFPYPTDLYTRMDNTVRIDHYLTSANRVMFRLIRDATRYILNSSGWQGFDWTRARDNYGIVAEDTHVFSPTLVNTARFGWYREKIFDGGEVSGKKPVNGDEAVKFLGLQGVNPQNLSAEGFPRLNITGIDSLYTQPGGMAWLDKDWGYADTAIWSKGKHVIKFGGEYKPQSRNIQNVKEGTYGVFNINGTYTGYGYADFLLGIPFSSTRLNQLPDRTMQDSELGMFITDDFKVNNRLTLNLGVRWDRFGSPNFTDGLLWKWDLATGNIVVPQEALKAVSPLYPSNIKIVPGQVRQNPSNTNVAPRLGGAYRFSDRFVVRGAYGIYTETLGRFSRLNATGPFEISETYNNQIVNGQPLFAFPNPLPASIASANIPSQSFTGYPLDTRNGRIHQFNVTLEHQVKDIGLRLTYMGSRNSGMNYSLNFNQPQPSLTPFTQASRPWPAFVGGTYYRSDGQQKYNALTIEARRRMGQLTLDVHYTFASNMTNMATLENRYAPLVWDRDANTSRHRAVANLVWNLPIGRGQTWLSTAPAVVDHILGGWQLYWIAYFESGRFFTPSFSGSDPSNTNTSGGRPDRICDGNLPSSERSVSRWFDASCFVVPPAGRFGNSGANILEGPGNHYENLSVAKVFKLTERVNFTFTAAAQNFLNHPNFAMPSADISAPGTVGRISALTWNAGYRVMELRGRIAF